MAVICEAKWVNNLQDQLMELMTLYPCMGKQSYIPYE